MSDTRDPLERAVERSSYRSQIRRQSALIGELVAALEWYGNLENYRSNRGDPITSTGVHRASPVERDFGDRARALIERAKKEQGG